MEKIEIYGGKPLHGSIIISGAKNSVLPLMAASLLTNETVTITNVPQLSDVSTMSSLLINQGVYLSICGDQLGYRNNHRVITLNSQEIHNYKAPYDIVRKMRASILVLGPMLARFGIAEVSLPGGCAIGTRPLNLHIDALRKMGALIELSDGYIKATTPNGLQGADINFSKVSVGATETAMMAATLANGKTTISNAAMEPEIVDLANFLNSMGAKITGSGSNIIKIEGVSKLRGTSHKVISDRIEASTYAIAAAITEGEVTLENTDHNIFSSVLDHLQEYGARIIKSKNQITVVGSKTKNPIHISTNPYPGFPTDIQAQFMALLSLSDGASTIKENMFENRYMHVSELTRMGANIEIQGNIATIRGVNSLSGAAVMATDLRASASLIIAGLAAQGKTTINRVYHIDRGYESIECKLGQCGASISRLKC